MTDVGPEPKRRGRPPLHAHIEVDAAFQPAIQQITPADTAAPLAVAPKGWESMSSAPDDGKPVWLLGQEKEMCEAVWRHSRRWDRNGGKWRIIGFWAIRNSGGQPILFQPVAWRPAA